MRIAESHAFAYQIISQVSGRGKAAFGRIVHVLPFGNDMRHHVGKGAQAVDQGVDRIEQRFLVFLVVLVVSQRLALHQHQQRHQVAGDTAGFASHQFGHIRVFLLRHDRRAGAEGIGNIDEVELRAGPQDHFFGKTRQMHHDQAAGSREFDGEIAVADRIERVGRRAAEAEQVGRHLPVDRVTGAGQCGSAQGHDVETFLAVLQPFVVTAQHFKPGHQVVAERDRLGNLQVREAGHDRVGFLFGQIEDGCLQAFELAADAVDLAAQIQANIGRHLVVARAARMQFFAGDADHVGQPRFDVHVHIFLLDRPGKLAVPDFLPDLGQAADDVVAFLLSQDADFAEHGRMRDGALDILLRHALVKIHRSGEYLNKGIGRLGKAGTGKFVGINCGHGGFFNALTENPELYN